jgi:hypothetical protein
LLLLLLLLLLPLQIVSGCSEETEQNRQALLRSATGVSGGRRCVAWLRAQATSMCTSIRTSTGACLIQLASQPASQASQPALLDTQWLCLLCCVRSPMNGDEYPPYNRPFSIQHWLEHSERPIAESTIIILDPDQMFLVCGCVWARACGGCGVWCLVSENA